MKIALFVGFMFFCSIWNVGKWDHDKMKVICAFETGSLLYTQIALINLSNHRESTRIAVE